MGKSTVVPLLLLFLVASTCHGLVIVPQTHSVTMAIAPQEQRCFYTIARHVNDRLYFKFQLHTGKDDFDVHVQHPDGNTVFQAFSGEHDGEGTVYFEAKSYGEYSFCIDNNGPSSTEKVIRVSAAVLSKKRADRQLDPLLKTLAKTEAGLIALDEDQVYMRARERDHRVTIESNNTRITVRWIIEVIALLMMSVGQVWYLRRLFSKKETRAA